MEKAPARPSVVAQGDALAAVDSSSGEKRLTQPKFVAAMVRLAAYRAIALKTEASACGSIGLAIEELVQKNVVPYADLTLGDALSERLKERKVRWVLEKWRDRLAYPFTVYATIDDEGSVMLMSLREMLALYRDAGVLDEDACTQYAVTRFFAIVNMDDELFEAAGGHQSSDNSLECTLDEFLEVSARVCDAKLAHNPQLLGPPPVLGHQWAELGTTPPKGGRLLHHVALEALLQHSTIIPEDAFDTLGLSDLHSDDYVKAGGRYFRPDAPGFEAELEKFIEHVYFPPLLRAAQQKVPDTCSIARGPRKLHSSPPCPAPHRELTTNVPSPSPCS